MERRREIINSDLMKELISLGCNVLKDELLSKHTSFRIGGVADYFVEVCSVEALNYIFSKKTDEQIFIIGGGTNILFGDEGFRGIVLKLVGEFEKFHFSDNELICGAAVSLPLIVRETAKQGLSGFECCAGIPGTIGGAVYGNAGKANSWISQLVKSVEIFENGKSEIIEAKKIEFEYRKSSLKGIILKTIFSLQKGIENDILNSIFSDIDRRKISQPQGKPNAGCIFKNPKNQSAGQLIEKAGLKGKTVGGAKISQIHANFIVNNGEAKAADVLNLIEIVKTEIKNKFNIDLETEIKVIQ